MALRLHPAGAVVVVLEVVDVDAVVDDFEVDVVVDDFEVDVLEVGGDETVCVTVGTL